MALTTLMIALALCYQFNYPWYAWVAVIAVWGTETALRTWEYLENHQPELNQCLILIIL